MSVSAAGADLFVHISRCVDEYDTLQPGTHVQFVEREAAGSPERLKPSTCAW